MRRLCRWLGMEPNPVSLKEKLVSALGAFAGIALTALISLQFVGLQDAALMIGSMGASAVLLFAVPHAQLSQPWPATVGQLISALVGVTCAQLVPGTMLAAALAVSLAVLAMHLTRSLHPPGGATALIAVIGGPDIHALGYGYVLEPVLLNSVSILLVALALNNLFGWRRYPAWISTSPKKDDFTGGLMTIDDLREAINRHDLILDVTEEELMRIYTDAVNIRRHRKVD